jgi:hypothetical protein
MTWRAGAQTMPLVYRAFNVAQQRPAWNPLCDMLRKGSPSYFNNVRESRDAQNRELDLKMLVSNRVRRHRNDEYAFWHAFWPTYVAYSQLWEKQPELMQAIAGREDCKEQIRRLVRVHKRSAQFKRSLRWRCDNLGLPPGYSPSPFEGLGISEADFKLAWNRLLEGERDVSALFGETEGNRMTRAVFLRLTKQRAGAPIGEMTEEIWTTYVGLQAEGKPRNPASVAQAYFRSRERIAAVTGSSEFANYEKADRDTRDRLKKRTRTALQVKKKKLASPLRP